MITIANSEYVRVPEPRETVSLPGEECRQGHSSLVTSLGAAMWVARIQKLDCWERRPTVSGGREKNAMQLNDQL